MVGGEQANNEEVKERRKKKKRYAEDRRKKMAGTVHLNIIKSQLNFTLSAWCFKIQN